MKRLFDADGAVSAPGRDHPYGPIQHTVIGDGAFKRRRPPRTISDLRLFGNFECVINLDAEIPHRRLQLGVSKQQLHGAKVLRTSVDQRKRPANPS